jgi:signal transduction histidine kinase
MRTVITSLTNHGVPDEFVDYLHAIREDERVALARRIHDELGGLLVSAAMDLGWAESHPPGPHVLTRLRRVGVSLARAIAMKRDMIEQLRPTLLDNFGLFEALRWYFKHACQRTEVVCTEIFPEIEISLPAATLSHVFRATQTLLDCTIREGDLKSLHFEATSTDQTLFLRIGHEHVGPETVDVLNHFRNELKSTAHRIAACQGQLSFVSREQGLDFYLEIPLLKAPGEGRLRAANQTGSAA